MSATIIFFVNGKKVVDNGVDPEWTLAWYIREKLRLTGTKLACEEGQCGSCTVLLGKFCHAEGRPKYGAVNGCLLPVVSAHGCAITTVEGIGSVRSKLHPVQERLAKGHGTQCGYCTPGFVMSMYSLLRNNQNPSAKEIENSLQGNLCRCTGYRSIIESFYTFGKNLTCGAKNCCKEKPELGDTTALTNWNSCQIYDSTQDPIFPPELQLNKGMNSDDLTIRGPRVLYFRPTSLQKLLDLLKEHPDAKIIASATLVGLMERYSVRPKATWIATMGVKELSYHSIGDSFVEFGAGLTLTEMQNVIDRLVKELPENQTRILRSVLHNLELLYSVQLRNVASWAGNVSTGSPISDLTVPFLGANCQVQIADSSGKQRWLKADENFFTGVGRKVNLQKDEIITAGRIPFSKENEFFLTYKQGLRRGSDSALVNAGLWVEFEKPGSKRVSDIRLSYGGMSSKPVLAKVAESLKGKDWDNNLLEGALNGLSKEFHLPPNSYGGRECYRTSLCLAFFLKFYNAVRQRLELAYPDLYSDEVSESENEGVEETDFPMEATQMFHETPGGQLSDDPVGRPIAHQYGERHTTGEAEYTPDVRMDNMCYLGIVYSKKAHAKLISIDPSEALKIPGVIAYVDASDIPAKGSNVAGTMMEMGDTVFATDEVTTMGERIGAIVAENTNVAKQAAQLVKVVYEDLPAVTTIVEAIEKDMFFGEPVTAVRGDAVAAMKDSELTLSDEVSIGGQEHMYMETMASVVVPGEGGEWQIYCATQDIPTCQEGAQNILGLKKNELVVKVKRVGGAFGGKLSQFNRSLWPALVAAEKVRRPVKCVLTRREDMIMTGKRHPGLCKYKVGFTKEGKITALDVRSYLDAGHTVDQSLWVLPLTVGRMDHCYWLPNVNVIGRACKTNLPSNTGFRGYGTPQGYFFMESIIDKIATHLNKPPEQVRELNFLKEGQRGLTDDLVRDESIYQCWKECAEFSKFQTRKEAVANFNQDNKWRKRGINLFPTRFGVGQAGTFFEQGSALVNIYSDGTVMISHGGVEMGQGINTKILQVASRTLDVPLEKITILENASDKVPNAMLTGGSTGSDMFGLAVKSACETILNRMKPLMDEKPKGTWEEWCMAAFMNCVSLSSTGFGIPKYETDDPKKKQVGNPRYYVCGTACTEVEVDCLTGDHKILSTDIVMDVGNSLNPAIDIGQIEGAFLQGYGLYVTEELAYAKNGYLLTDSAGKYKIPTVSTIPQKFRVALLKGNPEKHNLYSSKGIGEPPFALGMSTFFAIKDAINAYRKQQDLAPLDKMNSPATPERIRLLCEDRFTRAVQEQK